MDKLKPCPFCGGEAYVAQNYLGQKYVRCPGCGATMWGKDTDDWQIDTHGEKKAEKLAAKAWNRRASEASNEVIAKSKPKWISVEECPTKNVCDDGYTGYLVFSDGYIKVADYTCGFYVEGEYDPNVTHYMPLPEPPKGGDD